MKNKVISYLDELFPNAECELIYNKDYELLIAVILSAQSTDKRVNLVTKELFSKYDIFSLAKAKISDIEEIIKPVGTFKRKSEYLIKVAQSLVDECNGRVPNDRKYLESLPGVGHKTCNVVLSNLFEVPCFAVDTHVERISKRLNIALKDDNVKVIEEKLMKYFPKKKWIRLHHQFVLFGRYKCRSLKPLCCDCQLKKYCKKTRC